MRIVDSCNTNCKIKFKNSQNGNEMLFFEQKKHTQKQIKTKIIKRLMTVKYSVQQNVVG